jgi:hypothetical protein
MVVYYQVLNLKPPEFDFQIPSCEKYICGCQRVGDVVRAALLQSKCVCRKISGAMLSHVNTKLCRELQGLLVESMEKRGVDIAPLQAYVDAFQYGNLSRLIIATSIQYSYGEY